MKLSTVERKAKTTLESLAEKLELKLELTKVRQCIYIDTNNRKKHSVMTNFWSLQKEGSYDPNAKMLTLNDWCKQLHPELFID